MNNKELLIIICPIVYMILMILETYLYNKRVKRYLKINENIIKSLDETIEQRKQIESFFNKQVLEDFYKQVWDKLIKDIKKVTNEQ